MKLFNTTESERVATVTAFLTARYKDDEMAAISLLGSMEEGLDPDKISDLLLGLADFCISHIMILTEIAGITVDQFLETMGLSRERFTDWSK